MTQSQYPPVLDRFEIKLKSYAEWICNILNRMGDMQWGENNYHKCFNVNIAAIKEELSRKFAEPLPASLDIRWAIIDMNTGNHRILCRLYAVIMTVTIEKFLGCTVMDYHAYVASSRGLERIEDACYSDLEDAINRAYVEEPLCLIVFNERAGVFP